MSIEDQVSKREFSIKEVCDLLSAITCINVDGAPEDWVTTPEKIISNFCVEHSDEVLKDLCEHIEMLGITRIAEHTNVCRCEENPFTIAFGADYKKYL